MSSLPTALSISFLIESGERKRESLQLILSGAVDCFARSTISAKLYLSSNYYFVPFITIIVIISFTVFITIDEIID